MKTTGNNNNSRSRTYTHTLTHMMKKKNYRTLSFMSAHFSNNLSLCYKCSFCFSVLPGSLLRFFCRSSQYFSSFSLVRSHLLMSVSTFSVQLTLYGTVRETVRKWKRLFLWCFLFNVTTASTNRDSHAIHPYINPRHSLILRVAVAVGFCHDAHTHSLDEPHIHL